MNVLGIISSPHADGNGAALVREALRGAREAGAQVTEIFLPDYHLEFCRACQTCVRTGACPIPDDFARLKALLLEADGLIASSPTYGAAPCARIKNLFDRIGQFGFLTSAFGGKYVIGLATAGSFAARKVARDLAARLQHSVFRRAYVSGVLGVRLRGRQVAERPELLRRAGSLGARMVRDFRAGRRYPLQGLLPRLQSALLLRPLIRRAILGNRASMGGVYAELVRKGYLAPSA